MGPFLRITLLPDLVPVQAELLIYLISWKPRSIAVRALRLSWPTCHRT